MDNDWLINWGVRWRWIMIGCLIGEFVGDG